MLCIFQSLDGLESTCEVDGYYSDAPRKLVRAIREPLTTRFYYEAAPVLKTIQIREYELDRRRYSPHTKPIYVEQPSDENARLQREIDRLNKQVVELNRELGEAWAHAVQEGDEQF